MGNTIWDADEVTEVDAIAARPGFQVWAAANPEHVNMAKAISSRLRYLREFDNPLALQFMNEVLTRAGAP